MITFVHLSDIHFSPRDDLSQFDIDQQIRRALLQDLERKPAGGADYDGVLLTVISRLAAKAMITRRPSCGSIKCFRWPVHQRLIRTWFPATMMLIEDM
jgi:hypothetical protein